MKKIVTFGEILLRLSKPGRRRLFQGSVFSGDYGGSEANVAISLSQLGDRVEFITRVPNNAVGRGALLHLQQYGLSTRHIVRGGSRLGSYYFEEAAAMRNSQVVYDRDSSSFFSLRRGDIDWGPIFRDTDLFHCSGITCATSAEARDTTLEAVRLADAMGLEVTCDINYRKNLWRYPGADAHQTLHDLMQYSRFIFGDQGEWEVTSGQKALPFQALDASFRIDREAYRRYFDELHRQFPRCERMLMGHRNQLSSSHHVIMGVLWSHGEILVSPLYDVRSIVDQMGVGDAWVAAFIHARGRWPDDDQRCLDFSTAAAALKNTVPGDQNLVTEAEILEAMAAPGVVSNKFGEERTDK